MSHPKPLPFGQRFVPDEEMSPATRRILGIDMNLDDLHRSTLHSCRKEDLDMIPDVPYDLQAARENARKCVKDYFDQHKACPECASTSTSQTYMGCIMPSIGENGEVTNVSEFKDTNEATCKCGWKGIVHDMVPKT